MLNYSTWAHTFHHLYLFSEGSEALLFSTAINPKIYWFQQGFWSLLLDALHGKTPRLPPATGFRLIFSLLIALFIWAFGRRAVLNLRGFYRFYVGAVLFFVMLFFIQLPAVYSSWLFVFGPFAPGVLFLYAWVFGFFIFSFFIWYVYVTTNKYLSTIIFDLGVVIVLIFIFGVSMLYSRNFLWLFVAMVGLNILLYIALALPKTSGALEASAKYFSLGLVATVFLLLGILLIYAEYGTLDFLQIYGLSVFSVLKIKFFILPRSLEYIGLAFIILGLLFKLSAFPHFIWAADVYEGAALPVLWVLTASKIIILGVLLSVVQTFALNKALFVGPLLSACAMGSFLVGTFGALLQQKAKRFFAYSSINHIGFVLAGVATGFNDFIASSFYMFVYLFGAFVFLMAVSGARRVDGSSGFVYLSDLAQIAKKDKVVAAAVVASTFSLAGIPPFVGFFSKLAIFIALFHAQAWWSVLTLIVSLLLMTFTVFNYLRVLKTMLFKLDTDTFSPISVNSGGAVGRIMFKFFIFILFAGPLLSMPLRLFEISVFTF